MKIVAVLGALAGLLVAVAGVAAPAGQGQPRLIQIPFAPPLDQELHYELTSSKTSPTKSSTTKITEILRFSRVSDKYVLTINMTRLSNGVQSFDLASPSGMAAVPPEWRPFLLPVSLDVGTDGALLRVRDWPRLQRALAEFPQMMAAAAKSPEDRKTMLSIGQNVVRPFASLSAEQAPSVVLKGWPAFFGYGGAELEEGEEYEAENMTAGTLLPVAIPVVQRLSIARDENGKLRYRQVTTRDSKQVSKAVEAYVRGLGDGLDAAGRENLEKAATAMNGMNIEDHLDITFHPTSGLVETAKSERRISMGALGTGSEILQVSKLD